MDHEINLHEPQWHRLSEGQRDGLLVEFGPDFQAGDRVRVYPADRWGSRLRDFVERDAKGRFANEYRERPPYSTRITHVAADAPGVKGGWVLLSLAPVI